ncbi:hypothetical protein [Microcoleus sp. PH2017_28_MFU_U_A]|uniref:hypothetical protein n=1 Tax=Microcoleus sp. PH2017_28_MFU_U_A TaxID=2798838 RepID=UPI002D7E57D2|nr:hypothetical protein [Microcoleus sp. PH2017_28_MFU_U_A]
MRSCFALFKSEMHPVELLGTIYRPHRYDFKLKYFTRDFPAAIVDRVTPLFCIANLEDLAAKQQTAEAFFAEILPQAEAKLYSNTNSQN